MRCRGLLVGVGLVAGSLGCERVAAWFGEPRAEVEVSQQYASGGVSFAYPGNWRSREEPGEDGELRTIVLESRGAAIVLIQVFRPALAIDLDEHLARTLGALVAEFAARGGGVGEALPGAVAAFEREWLGAVRPARRAAIVVVMPGEEVASAIELHAAEVAGCTVLVFTMVPDAGRAQAAAGFELVLGTLAVDGLSSGTG